jgi:hypothetical protein
MLLVVYGTSLINQGVSCLHLRFPLKNTDPIYEAQLSSFPIKMKIICNDQCKSINKKERFKELPFLLKLKRYLQVKCQ